MVAQVPDWHLCAWDEITGFFFFVFLLQTTCHEILMIGAAEMMHSMIKGKKKNLPVPHILFLF